jgi:hypothetical protein
MELLDAIQEWYVACCDGEWEHTYGIRIQTLDNPGWMVDVDLVDTPLGGREFKLLSLERSPNDWVHCQVTAGSFRGRGGPRNLKEILRIFRNWAGPGNGPGLGKPGSENVSG